MNTKIAAVSLYTTLQQKIDAAHTSGKTLEELLETLKESKVVTYVPFKTKMSISVISLNGTETSPEIDADENKMYDYLTEYEGRNVKAMVYISNPKAALDVTLSFDL